MKMPSLSNPNRFHQIFESKAFCEKMVTYPRTLRGPMYVPDLWRSETDAWYEYNCWQAAITERRDGDAAVRYIAEHSRYSDRTWNNRL